jgi:DNA-binding response OmpR family regulator
VLRRAGKQGNDGSGDHDGPAHVLVVNDEPSSCELVCRLLAREGYVVDRALSHDEAIGQLNGGRPDCVVLDLSTGGIGHNLKLLEVIRSSIDPAVSNTRVVLIAQHTSNRMFSWQAGIDAFLGRPFHADELVHDIADALSRPDSDRAGHRRREANAASHEGRTLDVKPWATQRF